MNKEEFIGYMETNNFARLAPHKAANAIILSAGLSSRFQPVSDYRPKALLPVKGEILIERQIKQLQECGIRDIYIVVGYKKEQYDYLIEKYGVTLLENKDYDQRNNHSSIYAAREVLGNSYVCSSDNYFPENVFQPYVYDSYYAAQFAEGPTKEYCLDTDNKGRITQVTVGGKDSFYMMGHTYWSRSFAKQYLEYLEKEYESPRIRDFYWEDIYMEHLDTLTMYLHPYGEEEVLEFDNLEELCEFDTSYEPYFKSGNLQDLPFSIEEL